MRLNVFFVIAESQMVEPLRLAAARLNDHPSLPVRFEVRGVVAGDGSLPPSGEEVARSLQACDIFIASMLNNDREVRLLHGLLEARRPPVTAVFTSQPELMGQLKLGPLDGRRLFGDRAYARSLAEGIRAKGTPLPPLPPVLLAAVPRLEPLLGREGLGDLWAYARAALYWLQGSPDNLAALLLHLAAHHPAAESLAPELQREIPAPKLFPEVALWHPDAPSLFSDLDSYLEWYLPRWSGEGACPRVGLVLFRQYITAGSHHHYGAVIRALEARGIQLIPGFGGLDNTGLVQRFMAPAGIELLLNLTGFNLVGSMGNPQPQGAVELLRRLDVPYLVSLPLLFQTEEAWRADPLGLPAMQTALQVVLPELEGGIEPRVYGGRAGDGPFKALPRAVERLADRVERWLRLRRLPPSERRVALVVFSFPPDKGSVGSAAYLDVFQTVFNLMQAMKREGYRVDVPPDPDALRRAVLEEGSGGSAAGDEAGLRDGGPGFEGAVAEWVDGPAYRRLVPYWERLARHWGPPPGELDTFGGRIAIKGRAFGHVFVGIQPSFGYEGDPMRLLLSPDASPSHSFAAFYGWLEKEWGAHVLLHVGTHGALEFMPGKQVGLTPECYPDSLVGSMPHLYLYAVNNPAEATIAKRRGYAACITYLTPPLGHAGLYKDLAELKAALAAYRRADTPVARRAAADVIAGLIERSGLEEDLAARGIGLPGPESASGASSPSPKGPASGFPSSEWDEALERLADYLYELETEQIPLGLHTVGRSLDEEQRRRFLEAVLAHPRPEEGVPSLAELVEDPAFQAQQGEGRDPSRLRDEALSRLLRGEGIPPGSEGWRRAAEFSRDFLTRLDPTGETEAVLRALAGRYIPPSPGGEPGRRPEVLPTGRNLHALDPEKIPSPVARRAGREMAEALLARFKKERGRYPETVAMVLWGTDNIKTEGEGLAQALHLLGVEVTEDSRGRAKRLRLIPLQELGRPRIDVVMTVSGIFRDIFPGAMELLAEAARLAADADEPPELNFVRKHAREFTERLGVEWTDAAARVFSNRPGQYGTGVNVAVETSEWETEDELGHVFLERKGFAYGPEGHGRDRRELFRACLATAEVTFQNIDSAEISLADVDHYFEYLGGVTAAVRTASGLADAPPVYVADRLRGTGRLRSLTEALQVEARTRLLNPAWYENMLQHGYQGVHELASRLDNTLGWSATAPGSVGAWTYSQAADTFLLDETMRRRLKALNPRASYRMAGRLLEAAERGYWQPDERQRAALQEAFQELENEVELETTA